MPGVTERKLCSGFLARELELVDPRLLIPVGRVAINRFLGAGNLEDLVGKSFSEDGRIVVPLPHPSGANIWLNQPKGKELLGSALSILGEQKRELGL